MSRHLALWTLIVAFAAMPACSCEDEPEDSGAEDSGAVVADGGAADASGAADTGAEDAGCTTKAGDPCCVDDGQCASNDPCQKGSCDKASGECKTEAVADCCKEDTDCKGGTDCLKPVCTGDHKCDVEPRDGEDCDDGSACTAGDNCNAGKCAGTQTNCNDDDACTKDSCSADGKTCVNEKIEGCCTEGACCDVNAKKLRAKGVNCGNDPKVEHRCSDDGHWVEARFAELSCDGTQTNCPAADDAWMWSGYQKVKYCTAAGKCDKDTVDCTLPDKPATIGKCGPVSKPDICCNPETWQSYPRGKVCGEKGTKTHLFCVGNNLYEAEVPNVCLASSLCQQSKERLYIPPGKLKLACKVGESCQASSGSVPGLSGKCVPGNVTCEPGPCCDSNGTGGYFPKGTVCGDKTVATETTCPTTNATSMLQRHAYPGCSGTSSDCTDNLAFYTWGEYVPGEKCPAGKICKGGKDKGLAKASCQ